MCVCVYTYIIKFITTYYKHTMKHLSVLRNVSLILVYYLLANI